MSLRRLLIAVAAVCGACVWGFANSGDEPTQAQTANPVPAAVEEGTRNNRDAAEARYRANQSRHWRHVALGSGTNH